MTESHLPSLVVRVGGASGGAETDLVSGQGHTTRAGQQGSSLLQSEVSVRGGWGQCAVCVLISFEFQRLVSPGRVLVAASPHFFPAGLHPLVIIVILLLVTSLPVTVLGVLGQSPCCHTAAVPAHTHALLKMRRKPEKKLNNKVSISVSGSYFNITR